MITDDCQSTERRDAIEDLGHRFEWLHAGTMAYASMLRLIDAARLSVEFEFYTVKGGIAADSLGAALQRAAKRGVRVRVLLDAFGSDELPAAWLSALQTNGVQVRLFNPGRLLRWSFRDHRKLLVCDDERAVVGGFNVAPEYEGDGIERGWRDLAVVIDGPVASQLREGFDTLFRAASLHQDAWKRLAYFLRHQSLQRDTVAALVGGPGCPRALLRQSLHAELRTARRVDVIAAYFVPSRRIRRLLQQVARHGSVRVLLAGRSDVAIARLASQWSYPRLLRSGVQLWEFQPQVLHAKALVVDDVVFVGSANLDTRSLQLNFELLVRIPSASLAGELRARIDADCARSHLVPKDWVKKRTVLQRFLHGCAHFVLTKVDPYVAQAKFRHLA